MPLSSMRYIAPISTLALLALLPATASAATSSRQLCRMAERDPAGFMDRADLANNLLRMSESCPDLALALTGVTGSIPAATAQAGKGGKAGADFGALLKRLAKATDRLNDATDDVAKAQKALEKSVGRAKKAGLTDEDLDVIAALDGDGDKTVKRALRHYTGQKRQALENYLSARDRLAQADAALADATEKAKPLVQKAMELAGQSDAAQQNLNNVLGNETAEERKARLAAALDEAKQAVASLTAKIAETEGKLVAAKAALTAALNDPGYTKALSDYTSEEERLAAAVAKTEAAETAVTKAEAALAKAKARDRNCNGRDCREAAEDLRDAKRDLDRAEDYLDQKTGDVKVAQKALEEFERALNLSGISDTYWATQADLIAAQEAEAAAKAKIDVVSQEAEALSKLLSDAADALAKAGAASDEAKAATATEEAEVVAAKTALTKAIDEARSALAGSPEEAAALEAVEAAQQDLTEALANLGAAQEQAEAMAAEVALVAGAPKPVEKAEEALSEAIDASEAAEDEAEEAMADAEEALAEHEEATEDLSEALEEGGHAPAETSADAGDDAAADAGDDAAAGNS